MNNVFVVVVTYNGMKWLDRCLGSLEASETPVSIVVIDNASTDGTPDYIEKHFPNVHLIRSEVNYGFAKANNIGIRYSLDNGAEYFFLLNQDAWVEDDTISKLCETTKNDNNIGIVSPMHLNGNGNALDWGFSSNMPAEFISDSFCGKLKSVYYCDFINAAAWLITRTCVLTIGGFNTLMFVHYGEDGNYCQRVKYHGLSTVICTSARIYHDREFRKGYETEYRNKIFKQDDLSRRIEWCNLLYDIDIDSTINNTLYSIKRMRHTMRFKKAKEYAENLEFYRKVRVSREMERKKGSTWL